MRGCEQQNMRVVTYVLETGHIVTEGSGVALLESDAIRKAYLGG